MKHSIGVLLLLITMSSHSAVKQLTCDVTNSGIVEQRNFIFDTADFAKENPEADTILVETSRDKNEIWIDEEKAAQLGGNVTTHYQIMGVGNTYRNTFEVTPTFLTFMYVDKPECESSVGYGLRSVCKYIVKQRPMSISRKTLTGQDDDFSPPMMFSCELGDYSTEGNLL
jgi:hypothetical protein